MITYFDTSAIVPLIIDQPSSTVCDRLWNESDRGVSVRLLYPEACVALSRACRMKRITQSQLTDAIVDLDVIMTEINHVEITAEVARSAGRLAQSHDLRGYDAVHLASAASVAQGEFVFATGDIELAAAARSIGISVAFTN